MPWQNVCMVGNGTQPLYSPNMIPLGFSDFLTMNHYVDGKKYFTNENVRVRQKKLELNVEKTKRMMFNKRKSEENEWKCEGRNIKRVNKFKIVRKSNKVVGCVWGIGESKWRGDFKRRMMMLESMIESILM
jgi:translation initiation factor RLI1